jgi:hypothetical protein
MSDKPTLRDLVLGKQISKSVVKRSKALDKAMKEIMEERRKRKAKGGYTSRRFNRSEKEANAIRKGLRIGRAPSESGVKTIGAFHKEHKDRLGKHGRKGGN